MSRQVVILRDRSPPGLGAGPVLTEQGSLVEGMPRVGGRESQAVAGGEQQIVGEEVGVGRPGTLAVAGEEPGLGLAAVPDELAVAVLAETAGLRLAQGQERSEGLPQGGLPPVRENHSPPGLRQVAGIDLETGVEMVFPQS